MNSEVSNATGRKPRIMLLGEFSAGKSSLANALMKNAHSPVKVTATQVPPIWYSHGDAPACRIGQDEQEYPLDTDDLSEVPLDETRAVRAYARSAILERCDIIDMPGSSDPNMTADVWHHMLPLADAVIWCTPATQAWRQSEAAIWEEVPEALYARSLLLVTRIDKVRSSIDRHRVISRVARETDGLFRGVFPASLIRALEAEAEGNTEKWQSSGMAAFTEALEDVLAEFASGQEPAARSPRPALRPAPTASDPAGMATGTDPQGQADAALARGLRASAEVVAGPQPAAGRIVPRRVTPRRIARGAASRASRAGESLL